MTAIVHGHRRTTYRVALLAVLLVALGLVLSWAAATPSTGYTADEPATPANAAMHQHTWSSTGCSIPGATLDSVPGVFDFRHACVHHSGCYQGLDRQGAPARIDRLRCDQLFRADLQASCAVTYGTSTNWRAGECRSTAETYYEVVRSFGATYYAGSGNRA
jgi:phospholipase A2-like protein